MASLATQCTDNFLAYLLTQNRIWSEGRLRIAGIDAFVEFRELSPYLTQPFEVTLARDVPMQVYRGKRFSSDGFGVPLAILGKRCEGAPLCELLPPEGVFREATAWIETDTHGSPVLVLADPLTAPHARLLAPMQLRIHASADYARRHGLPASVEELPHHACINLRLPNGRLQEWHFRSHERMRAVTPEARLVFNDTSLVLQAALDGMGLAQLPACVGRDAVSAGKLVVCLDQMAPDNRSHYICYLSRRQQPARIRAFVDFMTTRIRESG